MFWLAPSFVRCSCSALVSCLNSLILSRGSLMSLFCSQGLAEAFAASFPAMQLPSSQERIVSFLCWRLSSFSFFVSCHNLVVSFSKFRDAVLSCQLSVLGLFSSAQKWFLVNRARLYCLLRDLFSICSLASLTCYVGHQAHNSRKVCSSYYCLQEGACEQR